CRDGTARYDLRQDHLRTRRDRVLRRDPCRCTVRPVPVAPRRCSAASRRGGPEDGWLASPTLGGLHQERHPTDRLDNQRFALQRLAGKEEQVERIPETNPPDDEEDSVAKQVLPEHEIGRASC